MPTQRQLFLQYVAQTSDAPLMLEIVKAEGIYLYDSSGKKYIDLISGIGVSNVGHRHPSVISAISDQLDKYLHLMVYGEFIQSPQVLLAKNICDSLPKNFNNVYFVNSGSEAVEGALKLAKRYTGKSEILYFRNAYHGSTHGALSINGDEYFKQPYRPLLPDTRMLEFNDFNGLDIISDKTAAVIIEPIQGEAGIRKSDPEFVLQLSLKCKEKGALLIFDEIQTGFGRTGKFWGFEHFDVVPDIIVCAKGMGGGMPIGAFISSQEIMSTLKHTPVLGHITTFGGHPVSCAASLAVIEVIKAENIISKIERKEMLFRKLLKHSEIKELRSTGLMIAAEFDSYERLKPVIDSAIEGGVLTDWFLHCNNAMRIAPPLTITEDEIEISCNLILEAIRNA